MAVWIAVGLLLALSTHHFVYGVRHAAAYGFVDFPIFLDQAREFLLGGELYVDAADPGSYEPAAAVYKFPPLYAMLLLPLVRDGIDVRVYRQHWGLQLLLYAAAVGLIAALYGRRPGASWLILGALLALNFEPFFETLWRLQIETPLLLLLALSLLMHVRGRDAGAGAALGVGTMLKLYPAFLLLYFGVRRRWAVIGWWAVTVGLILISALIVIGVEENRVYFFEILPLLSAEEPRLSTENLGLGRYVRQGFGAGPKTAKFVGQLLVAPLILVSLVAVYRWPRHVAEPDRSAVAFSLFVPLMLLAMPNSWVNYQLLLLLPMLVLLRYCLRYERNRAWLGTLLAAAYVPTLFYWPCADPSVGWPCAQTPYFLGLWQLPRALHDAVVDLRVGSPILLWAALLIAVERGRRCSS